MIFFLVLGLWSSFWLIRTRRPFPISSRKFVPHCKESDGSSDRVRRVAVRFNTPKRGDSNGSRRDEMLPKRCLIPPHRFGLAHVAVELAYGRGAGVGRGLAVGLGLAVALGVAVAVAVGVGVGVAVAVGVDVGVGVGVGDGLPLRNAFRTDSMVLSEPLEKPQR
jgi:hypothetical protein